MTVGDMPTDITKRVNNDPVEKVCTFKYIGSLKTADGDRSKDVNIRTHSDGETKNVRINHPVEGSVHPNRTGN